ncbi:MAG: hypothetical protein ACLP1X_18280 [Polyangiaceae bacterium]|jgi:hypothetical protein
MVKVALLARLVAKPGKEKEVAVFLSSAPTSSRLQLVTAIDRR